MAAAGRMEVVVATDAAYARPTAVALSSLARSTPGPLRITVLHDGVSRDVRERIAASATRADVEIAWLDLQDRPVLPDPSGSHLPRSACYRLAIGSVLPPDAHRCIYLDVDVLVRSSLRPLWETHLDGRTAAAVRSVHFPYISSWGAFDRWRDLGLDPRAGYFNSGVVLLDLDRWRNLGLEQRALAHLTSPLRSGPNLDQNAWNYVLHQDWVELHPRWNQQTPLLDDRRGAYLLYDDETVRSARSDAAVIHFLDRPKPWQPGCTHPAARAWGAAAAETPFGQPEVCRPSPTAEIRRRLRRAGGVLLRGR